MSQATDPLETIELETGPRPAASIIVLHGLGADGNDFVPVAQALDLAAVGPVRFVFPHAPVIPVTINNGWRMRAWYDILGMDLQRREDEGGVRRSISAIDALLAREQDRGIAASRIVLAGFSQGCAMSLAAGLRHGHRLGGVAGLSGYLPLAASLAAERHPANADLPVFLAHGVHDDIVPVERGRASRDALQALGHPVEWHEFPVAHTVSMDEVARLQYWLRARLAAS